MMMNEFLLERDFKSKFKFKKVPILVTSKCTHNF